MHLSTLPLLLGAAALAQIAAAAYSLQDDYSGNNFFDMFTFDTENDPTNGYVNYLDASDAQTANLTSVENGVVTIRSDSSNIASGRGRDSVRVTSRNQYTHGLVVLDLGHMPGSACGVWPAFWMTGPSWPDNGEIDIIEGVNFQSQNAMTLHTSSNCTMLNEACDNGCGIETGGPSSFGDGFNANGGGVYAMEWTSDAIAIWFFPHSNVPADALTDAPDPTGWGDPMASFVGGQGCDIDEHFGANVVVFDTTFCGMSSPLFRALLFTHGCIGGAAADGGFVARGIGDWAGGVWGQTSQCSAQASSCQDFVQNNPEAFAEVYWSIDSLKVYTAGAASRVV